ncbi:response regulator [Hyphobacterium marinum]|uniref:Response regulator n=1 Tax=Hyphobacterium marinum TaxID=3116574 RepID=A0ABU7LWK8_9PROT|nr:response regulator [Hyphobacterium sp. Y6023]MEE2565899.1 response regulator [Hyphobacterium sp. Y6023]
MGSSAALHILERDSVDSWRDRPAIVLEQGSLMRRLLTGVLRDHTAAPVISTADPKEALAAAVSERPGLIFADWSPFDEDRRELEFIRQVREQEDHEVRAAHLIVLTNRQRRRDIQLARDAGATDYLLKPIPATTIVQRADSSSKEPRAFVQSTRFNGPDRRRRKRDANLPFKRGADVRAGRVDPLSAARNAVVALAEEVAPEGCPLTRRVVVSLNRYLGALEVFTPSDDEVIEMHRAAIIQLIRAKYRGDATGEAVVRGLETVVQRRLKNL